GGGLCSPSAAAGARWRRPMPGPRRRPETAMDPYAADPHWGGYIVWYFYLGGIAAGAYAVGAMAAIFGGEPDRRATRPARYIAFPPVCLCGLLLTIDLGPPGRVLALLVQSEAPRPVVEWGAGRA